MNNTKKKWLTLVNSQPVSLELIGKTFLISALTLRVLVALLLVITTTLTFGLWQINPLITIENAQLEISQSLFLLTAALLQGMRGYQTRAYALSRDIRLGLALFAFAFFLREVDIDKIGPSDAWSFLEIILRATTLLLFLGIGIRLWRNLKLITRNLTSILSSPTVVITILGCIFYAFGWPFDKEVFDIDKGLALFFEETLELNACLLICFAGLFGSKNDNTQIR